MNKELPDSDKAFLQLLMARSAVLREEAEGMLARCRSRFEDRSRSRVPLDGVLRVLNEALRVARMRVARCLMPGEDGNRDFIVLFNDVADEIAHGFGTGLSDAELAMLKSTVAQFKAHASFDAAVPLGAVMDMRGKLPLARAQQLVSGWRAEGWFIEVEGEEEEGGRALVMGPRLLVELSADLRDAGVQLPQIIYY